MSATIATLIKQFTKDMSPQDILSLVKDLDFGEIETQIAPLVLRRVLFKPDTLIQISQLAQERANSLVNTPRSSILRRAYENLADSAYYLGTIQSTTTKFLEEIRGEAKNGTD